MSEVTYILGGNIELEVEFNYTAAIEGNYGGPIDRAEPPQPEEIEILSVTCNGKEVDTDDIGIFNSGTYETLDNEIEDFISTSREDWMSAERDG